MAGESLRGKGRSRELVFGDIAGEKDAQGIRNRRTTRRQELFGAASTDRIRLHRFGHRGGRRRESVAAYQAIGGDGRRRRALRGGKLPAAEKRFRRDGRGICESTGEQSKIGGADLRHRGLWRETQPAGAAAGGSGYGGACGAGRPEREVLPGRCAGLEKRKPRGSRAIAEGIREESAPAIGIPAAGCGARVAGASVRRPEQDGRRGEG